MSVKKVGEVPDHENECKKGGDRRVGEKGDRRGEVGQEVRLFLSYPLLLLLIPFYTESWRHEGVVVGGLVPTLSDHRYRGHNIIG